MASTATGRCLCGSTRFVAGAAALWSCYCHCDSCRRATASPVTVFVGFPAVAVTFTGEGLAHHASSPGVERGFCQACGTPLWYRSDRWPGEVHVYAATLDDPAAFPPTFHVHWAEKLPWLTIGDALPKYGGGSAGEPGAASGSGLDEGVTRT